jgi:hypothetical protein
MSEQAMVLNDVTVSRMAREVARNLFPVDRIRDAYKLSVDEFDAIVGSQMFQQRLGEELEIWNASTPMAISTRISAKAATMIEESIAEVYTLIHDRAQPMAAKVEALKWASRIAGIGERAENASIGDRVVLNINFTGAGNGERSLHIEKVIEPLSVEISPLEVASNG